MRAAFLTAARTIEVRDIPEPELVAGTVIVEVDFCAVAESDVLAFKTGELSATAGLGHQWVGRVVAAGSDTPDRFEGERVIGAAPPPCGGCAQCRAGWGVHCTSVVEMIAGVDELASKHGAFAERVRVAERRVHRVPDGLDDPDATLAEPSAVAVHAVARAGLVIGDLVVVVGAGTVGLLVGELARLGGASAVVAIDADPLRRELMCDLGAVAAFPSAADAGRWLAHRGNGLGADVAFACGGSSATLEGALASIRRGGTAVAISVAQSNGSGAGEGSTSDSLLSAALLEREASLLASAGYQVSDVQRALDLMADDRLRVAPIYQPEPFPLSQLAAVVQRLADDPSGHLQPLISPHL